ncbi:HIT family protein [Bacillus sp. B1-b2]|uniref:HIT family protein n=1 Tax=Bacillus sp. B1-b2 TaxID=2653201 RepID=UPI001869CA34|nr:HIT family protein [Bacillus sp. B1-b2]
MNVLSDCIFCKIIAGEIPAKKVFENDHVIAFLDISQVTKGHTLVVPKTHVKDIFELTPKISKDLFEVVPTVATAIKEAYNPIGLNLLNNNGEKAGQSVFHYHMHIIPRYGKGDGFGAVWKTNFDGYTSEELTQIADDIKEKI